MKTRNERAKELINDLAYMSLESEHASVYETDVEGINIYKCVHVMKKNDYDFGRSYTHYSIKGKVYKTHKSAVERINALLAEKGESE